MLAEERRTILTGEIHRTGQIITSEMAARLGVSDVTIRADLEALERRGRVTRTHGGAVAGGSAGPVIGFDARLALQRDEKRRIALTAAEYIHADQTIILDNGTTAFQLAQILPAVTGLTVLTPSIPVAQHLLTVEGVDTYLLGGRIDPYYFGTVGTAREQGIKDVLAHTMFLGAQAVDDDLDIIDTSRDLARNKRQLVRHARKIVLIIGSGKWNKNGPAKVMPLSRVDVVITDTGIAAATRRRIEARNIALRVV
jgi:DeoR family transcriptional regulator of aga operon